MIGFIGGILYIEVMSKIGFCEKWRKWISMCLGSIH